MLYNDCLTLNVRSDHLLITKQGTIAITAVCIVFGMMLAIQFRATENIQSNVQFQRAEDIIQRLGQVETERNALLDQIRELRDEGPNSSGVSTDMESITMKSGLVPLHGTGIIITVNENKQSAAVIGKNPTLYLIRDEDILKIMNELRAAGAEAIAINDQRLIASSEIRTAGSSISINNTHYNSPFEIKAIGNPTTLENALNLREGVVETLNVWGIQVSIKRQDDIYIPAYKGVFRFNHGRPIKEGEK
jgi:uncharacterized protein YlxW (UPF0749 family)